MEKRSQVDKALAIENILAALPKDVVIHLLKTTNLAIADVFIFCRTNRWSYNLCTDNNVWKTIYSVRFPDIALRRRVDAIYAATPEGFIFRYEPYGVSGTIRFDPPLRISSLIGTPGSDPEDLSEVLREIINTINQICGPPDEIDDAYQWSRPLGVLKTLFEKMIIYKLLSRGFTTNEPLAVQCSICKQAEVSTKCDQCNQPICGDTCLNKHVC